jgi:hypothetical protein
MCACQLLLEKLQPVEFDARMNLLLDVIKRHADGQQSFVFGMVSALLEKYVRVEGNFSGMLDRYIRRATYTPRARSVVCTILRAILQCFKAHALAKGLRHHCCSNVNARNSFCFDPPLMNALGINVRHTGKRR